jgi:hypothetical protein
MPPAVRYAACPKCHARPGERCRSLATRIETTPTAKPLGEPVLCVHAARNRAAHEPGRPTFRIVDERGQAYIVKDYPTQRAASLALADLLRPYSLGDPWRRRLRVAVAVGELLDAAGHDRSSDPRDGARRGGRASWAARREAKVERGAVQCGEPACGRLVAVAGLCRYHYDTSRALRRKLRRVS